LNSTTWLWAHGLRLSVSSGHGRCFVGNIVGENRSQSISEGRASCANDWISNIDAANNESPFNWCTIRTLDSTRRVKRGGLDRV
jgi:hypothetical protein